MAIAKAAQAPEVGAYDYLVRPDGFVHRDAYVNQEVFDAEMQKVFGGSWVFLLHESEIAEAFDFKLITVGRRSTIVTRAANGSIHALLNRCTHRGSQVCFMENGNTRRFTCPYHAWSFGSDGSLVNVPFKEGYGPSFDQGARRLGRFPRVESYRGFVFGSLNADVEPLTDWLAGAREILDWSIDNDRPGPNGHKAVRGVHMTCDANWKLQNDNNTDGYHAGFLHASTAEMNRRRHGEGKGLPSQQKQLSMSSRYLGNGHKFVDQREYFEDQNWERARPVPGRETQRDALIAQYGEEEALRLLNLTARGGINLIIYPNLFILGNGSFAVYEPIAVDKTHVRYYIMLINDAPPEVNNLRIRFEEDFNTMASRDDSAALQSVQDQLTNIPEMQWVDVTRGIDEKGRTNPMDETPVRDAYGYWVELMNRDVTLTV